MRLVRVDIVGPDVVLPARSSHRRPLLNGIGILRNQLMPANSGPCELSRFADRLRITDGRSTIPLPSVVTSATDHAGPLGRKIPGVDDEARSALVGHMLRSRTVTAFAAD